MDLFCVSALPHLVFAVLIIGGALVSEDGATISAATLAAAMIVDVRFSFASALTGLWLGDLGVYALARWFNTAGCEVKWFSRVFDRVPLEKVSSPTPWSLAASRFFPGTRFPAYLAAGLGHMDFGRFAAITGFTAALYAALVFEAVRRFPLHVQAVRSALATFGTAGLLFFVILYAGKLRGPALGLWVSRAWQRAIRWEFWPAWLFYFPVAGMIAWLGLHHHALALPTAANPGQKNGGLVGESKIEILRALRRIAPSRTVGSYLIPAGGAAERIAQLRGIVAQHGVTVPFVMKPDTAQRGAGFRKIDSLAQAETYLQEQREPLVLQPYVPGPFEAGIFYYRFPGWSRGRIFGITRKVFPVLAGDGIRSIRQLIQADDRARFLAHVYVRRVGSNADRIPAAGERVRIVEAGNHCQGCIFQDGRDLHTRALRKSLDDVSLPLPGFYVGRFDIRYADDEELRGGTGYQIIELNGAASEATHLYDCRYSLWSAYRTLYRQWKLIYAIAAENRKRGSSARSAWTVWCDWREFARRASAFPVGD